MKWMNSRTSRRTFVPRRWWRGSGVSWKRMPRSKKLTLVVIENFTILCFDFLGYMRVCVCVCVCLSASCFSSCLSLIVQEKEAAKNLRAQTKAKGKGRGRGRGQGRGQQKGRGKGRSRNAQVSAVQLPQVQESDGEVEKGDAVDEEMQVPAAGEVTEVDEEMQVPDVALPTGVLPPATPVSTTEATSTSVVPAVDATEATSTSVVPAMDAEHQLSAELLLATENPVAEDLLAAGPSNVPSTIEGIEPDPSTSVSPPHAAAPVVPEEPAAPVVPEEPAAPVVPEEPAAPVVPRFVSAKEHQTPAMLQRLAPPFCTFALDFKAHRFTRRHHLQMSGQSTSSIQCQCPKHLPTCLAGRMPWRKSMLELGTGGTLPRIKADGSFCLFLGRTGCCHWQPTSSCHLPKGCKCLSAGQSFKCQSFAMCLSLDSLTLVVSPDLRFRCSHNCLKKVAWIWSANWVWSSCIHCIHCSAHEWFLYET